MEIEAVDFFFHSMPVVTDEGDGSQGALVVKVSAGDFTGCGECEASPLVVSDKTKKSLLSEAFTNFRPFSPAATHSKLQCG